ncbi:MAG: hypothetical protein EA384_09475 [Spirochaetaceae bacterium]|nr:MAG: hypothetical protein EA384_09475 [Spirochaetaceae bacterium]
MKRFEELTSLEQVLLLGFIPILGATSSLGAALAAAVIGVLSAVLVWLAARLIPASVGNTTRWGTLVALGIGLSYGLSLSAAYLVPLPAAALVYLYLAGATPLVYFGAGSACTVRQCSLLLLRYVAVVLAFGVVREALGNGTLLGVDLWQPGVIPAGILASGTGALLLFAGVAFVSHMRADLKASRARENQA